MNLPAPSHALKSMPRVGFGLWKVSPEDCADTVRAALEAGYRHFDCAADYGNEAEVGSAIASAIEDGLVTRDDLWITSKLWNSFHAPEHVPLALDKTLQDLQLDRLDLYLVHFPIALEYVDFAERYPPEWRPADDSQPMARAKVPLHQTWQAMEELHDSGKVGAIGVCNYSSALLHDLMSYARIAPAMLQVELHPYLTQERLMRTALEYDIDVTAFSPLGALSYVELDMAGKADSVLQEAAVQAAADRHSRSPAQIVLRWGVQRGCAVIPKSTNPQHMRDNRDLDFQLSDDEMQAISALDDNRRFNDPGSFTEDAFGTFHAIYD